MLNLLRRSEIALGFLLASIFWTAVLGWQASHSPTERQKEECYEAAKKTGYKADECKTFWEKTTSDPIALFNLLLAFSTAGLWVATISLSRAGTNQIRLAREEFVATHRPKIKVHAVEITRRLVDEENFLGASILCFNVLANCGVDTRPEQDAGVEAARKADQRHTTSGATPSRTMERLQALDRYLAGDQPPLSEPVGAAVQPAITVSRSLWVAGIA